MQYRIEGKINRIGKGKYGRVFKMARKPTDIEYAKTCKITGAGILISGGLGFFIWIISELVVP